MFHDIWYVIYEKMMWRYQFSIWPPQKSVTIPAAERNVPNAILDCHVLCWERSSGMATAAPAKYAHARARRIWGNETAMPIKPPR